MNYCVSTTFSTLRPARVKRWFKPDCGTLRSSAMIDKRFRSQEAVERVQLESKEMEYLYQEGDTYVFMDSNDL